MLLNIITICFLITAVGGKGASGQDGGDGVDAQSPEVELLFQHRDGTDSKCSAHVKEIESLSNHEEISHDCWPDNWKIGWSTHCNTLYEFRGSCARDFGAGGKGAEGGFHGDVRIFDLGSKSNITLVLKAGPDGEDGVDGREGKTSSLKIRMSCHVEEFAITFTGNPFTGNLWSNVSSELDDSCPKFDKKPKNTKGMIMPTKLPFFDPTFHLSEYLVFIRGIQVEKLKRDDVLDFVDAISNDDTVLANYSLNGFVNELLMLEEQYYSLKGKIELQSHYYWFSSKLEKFVAKGMATSHEQLNTFTYLYTAAWGKYVTLKTHPFLIIDIQSYLDSSIRTIIEKVDKSKRLQIIDEHRKQYHSQITSKIDEVNALINSDIKPVIEDIKAEFNTTMNSLVEETLAMRQQAMDDVASYEAQLVEVRKQTMYRMMFGVLDVVSTFASCLGPYGMAAGMVIEGASQIGRSFVLDGKSTIQPAIAIPAGVHTALQGAKTAVMTRTEKKLKILNEQVTTINETLFAHSDQFGDTLKEIDDIHHQLQTTDLNDKNAVKSIDEAEKKVNALVKDKKNLMEKNPSKFPKKTVDKIQLISDSLTVIQASMNVYQDYQDGEYEMSVIREALETSNENIEELEEFERTIYADMWPMLLDMLSEVNEIEQKPTNSHASIDIKKFKIQSRIRNIRFQMHKFVKGFEMEEDLMQTFQKLDDVYLTLISLYDRIEDYQDEAKLGDFISNIASDDIENYDPILKPALHRLDLIINSNVLLNQHKLAIDGFKHTVFPFASYYLEYYKLPTNLQVDDFSMLATHARNQLESLKTKYKEYHDAVINDNDEFIVEATFVNSIVSSEPFYEWRYVNHANTITDLLSGKSVKIQANIQLGVPFNAVKFNLIKLAFENRVPSLQTQLEKKILNFDVKMTHMGNSYYRCGTSYYLMHSPATIIIYSNQEQNGVPLRNNIIYNKLLNGDILLSPYALWTIQLEFHGKGNGKTEFGKLKKLAKGTDLFLVGKGIYVRNDVPICSAKVDDYKDFEIDL